MPKFVVTIELDDVEVSLEASSKEEALENLDELVELSQKVSQKLLPLKPLRLLVKKRVGFIRPLRVETGIGSKSKD